MNNEIPSNQLQVNPDSFLVDNAQIMGPISAKKRLMASSDRRQITRIGDLEVEDEEDTKTTVDKSHG